MTEKFGEAWSPMSVPDLAPDDDDELFKACEAEMSKATKAKRDVDGH